MAHRPIVILSPNSFERFRRGSHESQFQISTRSRHLASLLNLHKLFGPEPSSAALSRRWKDQNPMAGYYLESFLRLHGYEARAVFEWDDDRALEEALSSDPLAIAFSTTYVCDRRTLNDCLAAIRRVAPGIPIVVGGPYILKQRIECFPRGACASAELDRPAAAMAPELRDFGVDAGEDTLFTPASNGPLRDAIYVASEFGEHTLLRVLEVIERKGAAASDLAHVPNLVLPEGRDAWVATGDVDEPVDLDRDYTRWDLVEQMPPLFVPVRSSVGCPYRCRYCDFKDLHPKVRERSPASLVEEIRLAKARGARVLYFTDDNVFTSTRRSTAITRALAEADLGIRWGGFFRVDRINERNVDTLVASGCHFGLCGIESFDAGQLRRMNKRCRPEEMTRGIRLCLERGIHLQLTLIVGFPGETRDSLDATAAAVNALPTGLRGWASFLLFPLQVVPGSAIDGIELRRAFALRGRHARWTHATMSYEQAVDTWSPYLFRRIESLPYGYGNEAVPGWSHERRDRAFRARGALTLAFLDREPDHELQRRFAALYRVFRDDVPEPGVPPWQTMLADRAEQPGRPRPLERV